MLRKGLLVVTVASIVLGMGTPPTYSAGINWKKSAMSRHVRQDHHAYRQHQHAVLHMYPVGENGQWQLTLNAPRGLMKYWLWGQTFAFTFKGIKLAPHTDYTLIYAVDSDTASDIVLGEGMTDRHGRVYFENNVDICSMPAEYDANYPYGARILLVPSAMVAEGTVPLVGGSGDYLEGTHLIKYFDVDGCDTPVVDDGEVEEFPEIEEEPQSPPVEEFPELETPPGQPAEDNPYFPDDGLPS